MSYYTFAAMCGSLIAACFVALVVLETIRVHRTQINRELAEDNRRLRTENAYIRSRHANAVYAITVHEHEISARGDELRQLRKENNELRNGMPVMSGFTTIRISK